MFCIAVHLENSSNSVMTCVTTELHFIVKRLLLCDVISSNFFFNILRDFNFVYFLKVNFVS